MNAGSVRDEMTRVFRDVQEEICQGLVAIEREQGSNAEFREDRWERTGGGGGWTRVLAGGRFLEKAGVNVSAVHGDFPEDFARQLPGTGTAFFATGVSLVLHPLSPHVPTVHLNFRYIEHGTKRWFGGGADLTPYYFVDEDRTHFHDSWRGLCERHPGVGDYAGWRDECDRYFYLPHRGERRGVGGIFFDNVFVDGEEDWRRVCALVKEGGSTFLESYLPIAKRRLDTPVTDAQRRWHELRRGRYVEFNLVYDRGTIFGLKTGGRTESILMSLPPRVRWEYDYEPPAGSPEAALLEQLRKPPPAA